MQNSAQKFKKAGGAVYVGTENFVEQLRKEIPEPVLVHGNLFLTKEPPIDAAWAQNIWHHPVWIEIESIGDAAKKLKSLQRNWYPHSHDMFRRTQLIVEKLPNVNDKEKIFPYDLQQGPMGAFCLINPNLLLASQNTSSPFPGGKVSFTENRTEPPSRAYLKLWEALTLMGEHPRAGDKCLELGACPGGWTWVIGRLGADVLAVDRSPLADNVNAMKSVSFVNGNAFGFLPETHGPYDWIFSDLICYPEKLLDYVTKWTRSGKCKRMVCTIKFQGDDAPYEIVKEFNSIPGSIVRHLNYNKHELTWMWRGGAS